MSVGIEEKLAMNDKGVKDVSETAYLDIFPKPRRIIITGGFGVAKGLEDGVSGLNLLLYLAGALYKRVFVGVCVR